MEEEGVEEKGEGWNCAKRLNPKFLADLIKEESVQEVETRSGEAV